MNTKRRTATLLLAVLVAAVAVVGCETTGPDRAQLAGLTNNSRAQAGARPLAGNLNLDIQADAAARRLRDSWVQAGCPANTGSFLVHTGDLAGFYQPWKVTNRWKKVGENIGVVGVGGNDRGAATIAVHDAYMNSPSHRDNILDSTYRWVGLGVVYGPTDTQKANGSCPDRGANTVQFTAEVFVSRS
jgi:uncharacterized protein YkwD